MLIVVTTVAITLIWGQTKISPSAVNPHTHPPALPPQSVSKFPQVSSQGLFNHVERLNFRRYTPEERSRTRKYIIQQLQKFGWQAQLQRFDTGINIVATKPGTDTQAGKILIAAHYDTVEVSPGADDNSSGIAVLLEIARLYKNQPTIRTLELAFFDQEEAGLLGSKAFTTEKQNLDSLQAVIVMDMIGYACYTDSCQQYPTSLLISPPSKYGDFIAVVGDTEHLPLLNSFNHISTEKLPPVFTLPVPLKGLLSPDTLRSDHAPFWVQGIGAVLITDTANLRTPYYHQSTDIPANINQKFFTGVAQIVVNVTTEILNHRDSFKTPQT
ncbi:M28 family peptidase [Calothrix sp. 336/3]